MRKFLPDWRTVLSAALCVAAFPPWNLWPLLWIGLVPWLVTLNRVPGTRRALLQGFWLGALCTLGGCFWLPTVLHRFHDLSWPVAILGLGVFCVIGQPQFLLFAAIYKKFQTRVHEQGRRTTVVSVLLLALGYAGLDWALLQLHAKVFQDSLGNGFYLSASLRQLADLGGVTVITFLIVFMNLAIAAWADSRRVLVAAAALCLVGWGYGAWRQDQVARLERHPPRGFQLAAIQASIGDVMKTHAEKGKPRIREEIFAAYAALTDTALGLTPRPEVILWPETAYPQPFRRASDTDRGSVAQLNRQLLAYSRTIGVPLLFGAHDKPGDDRTYNAFYFLNAADVDPGIYRKNILMAFGEYLPAAQWLPFLDRALPTSNYARGPGASVLELRLREPALPTVTVAPTICYEALIADYNREAAALGAEVFINIANDSYFGDWPEPEMHLALATFRSVENRLPMVRSANSGISALVLPSGEITNATRVGERAVMNVFVPLLEPIPTLYKAWGEWFGSLALALGATGLLLEYRRRR